MILYGDAKAVLKTMPAQSANCCVTSPPYWGLRDYGVNGQLGLEKTPQEYISRMVEVFDEVRRVLRDDGTLWLNIGDTYARSGLAPQRRDHIGENALRTYGKQKYSAACRAPLRKIPTGLKPKDLIGIPWMLAFALRDAGWYLRQEIIWGKRNPVPESVNDRCTRSHEQIFLLAKSRRYYWNKGAMMEPVSGTAHARGDGVNPKARRGKCGIERQNPSFSAAVCKLVSMRNKRSIWMTVSRPFADAHFATFPEDLIEPCILASCPSGGVVLDPFFGAGTTGLVALKNNRQFIGIELNQEYIEIAKRRLENVPRKLMGF